VHFTPLAGIANPMLETAITIVQNVQYQLEIKHNTAYDVLGAYTVSIRFPIFSCSALHFYDWLGLYKFHPPKFGHIASDSSFSDDVTFHGNVRSSRATWSSYSSTLYISQGTTEVVKYTLNVGLDGPPLNGESSLYRILCKIREGRGAIRTCG
jgi:hypothetical protein